LSNKPNFPMAIPFGGSGDKEMITVTREKGKNHINTFGKARFNTPDSTDIVILLAIGTDKDGHVDKGTVDIVESLSAASINENGYGRAEHLMMKSGIIAPGSLPRYGRLNGHDDNGGSRLFRNHNRDDQQDEDE